MRKLISAQTPYFAAAADPARSDVSLPSFTLCFLPFVPFFNFVQPFLRTLTNLSKFYQILPSLIEFTDF